MVECRRDALPSQKYAKDEKCSIDLPFVGPRVCALLCREAHFPVGYTTLSDRDRLQKWARQYVSIRAYYNGS